MTAGFFYGLMVGIFIGVWAGGYGIYRIYVGKDFWTRSGRPSA